MTYHILVTVAPFLNSRSRHHPVVRVLAFVRIEEHTVDDGATKVLL